MSCVKWTLTRYALSKYPRYIPLALFFLAKVWANCHGQIGAAYYVATTVQSAAKINKISKFAIQSGVKSYLATLQGSTKPYRNCPFFLSLSLLSTCYQRTFFHPICPSALLSLFQSFLPPLHHITIKTPWSDTHPPPVRPDYVL